MRRHQLSYGLLLAGGFAAVFASLYCLLLIVSASSLACTECNCEYSLFAPIARCRQPYVAMILAALPALLAAGAFISASRVRKRPPDEA
jgi:hypothetical protein